MSANIIRNNGLKICTIIRDLLDKIEDSYEETVDNILDQLDDLENKEFHKDPIDEFADMNNFVYTLQNISETLSGLKLDNSVFSDTARIEIYSQINKLLAKYQAFSKDVQLQKIQMINELSDKFITEFKSKPDIKLIDELRSKYYKNKHLVSLYANILQIIIDDLFHTDKALISKLLNYIEEDKTYALQGNAVDIFKKAPNNPFPTRFGLLPTTDSLLLQDLCGLIFAEEKKAIKESNLAKLIKSVNAGFIIISNVVFNPVEFNIRPLLIKELAEKYLQPKEAGITGKTVDRFKTIEEFKPTNKWKFSIDVYNKTSDRFYILETLDGSRYRCLAPWVRSNRYSVPAGKIAYIINYQDKPSRATEYHTLATKKAVNNMFLSRALDLEDFNEKKIESNSGHMQQKIIKAVNDKIDELIKKEYKNKITQSKQVSELLQNPEILATFTNEQMTYFSEDSERLSAGKFPSSELIASFITSTHTVQRVFTRELYNSYNRFRSKDEIFSLPTAQSTEAIKNLLHQITEKTINLIFNSDDNIYNSLYLKYLILNFT